MNQPYVVFRYKSEAMTQWLTLEKELIKANNEEGDKNAKNDQATTVVVNHQSTENSSEPRKKSSTLSNVEV